jgi:prophage antirepressor-like protein
MQYSLKVFETEDHHSFRTMMIDGEPWFVLSDVCRALDISNTGNAAARLDDDEKGIRTVDTPSGPQRMVIINESALYSLILTSRKEGAKRFKKWVTSEVLPSIRKTGGYGGKVPAFIKRFNDNWDRVDNGHFSVISELTVRLWGRLEAVGHVMADKAYDGTELRPDISVGRHFAEWLRKHHPTVSAEFSYYSHLTPAAEVEARQYPNAMLPLFIEFVDTVWIPEHAESYFRSRDPAALPHLPKLLPSPDKPRPGMMKRPALARFGRRH